MKWRSNFTICLNTSRYYFGHSKTPLFLWCFVIFVLLYSSLIYFPVFIFIFWVSKQPRQVSVCIRILYECNLNMNNIFQKLHQHVRRGCNFITSPSFLMFYLNFPAPSLSLLVEILKDLTKNKKLLKRYIFTPPWLANPISVLFIRFPKNYLNVLFII